MSIVENNLKYWILLSHFPKFGQARLKKLYCHFTDMELAWRAGIDDLLAAGIDQETAVEFISQKKEIDPEKIFTEMDAEGIKAISIEDENYPPRLKEIYDAPALLYYKGEFKKEEPALAVVGTRKYTSYGQRVTEGLIADLVGAGMAITSGLALGIDALAHEATLKNQGRAIAVLGSGLAERNIYPTANRQLAQKILANGGVLLSEYPPSMEPQKFHFPQRNRIISGLSLGTVIIEAGGKSGSLITAKCALDQNRDVFAVPGNIFSPASEGTNEIIKQGAKLVTSANDILESLNLALISSQIETKKIIPATPEEQLLLSHLTHEPIHANDLIRLTKLDTSVINSTLTIMEMKGMVRNVGGGNYILLK